MDPQVYQMNLIQQLAGIIEGNLNSPLSVNVLAERSGYSERWLYKLFQDVTGISVAQYIRRRKLTLAALLLRHTSRRITDISLMYEFSSPQAFSRAFRQQFKGHQCSIAMRMPGICSMPSPYCTEPHRAQNSE